MAAEVAESVATETIAEAAAETQDAKDDEAVEVAEVPSDVPVVNEQEAGPEVEAAAVETPSDEPEVNEEEDAPEVEAAA